MAVFTRIKTWVSNEVLTAADLNNEFNNIINNMIPTGIEDYSATVSEMQSTADPGGLGTESLATTLAGEITRLRYAIKRIVGKAQWYMAPDFDLDGQIGTANITDASITTDKIASEAVTRPKLAPVATGISASSTGLFSTTSTSYVDVTNCTATITTGGGPLVIILIPDGTTGQAIPQSFGVRTTSSNGTAYFKLLRGASDIAEQIFSIQGAVGGSGVQEQTIPLSAFVYFETPAAGTYTYKMQAKVQSGSTAQMYYAKLYVYELR